MLLNMKKIIGILILVSAFISCAQQAEDSIRLIPDDYIGPVLIIFDQEDGEPEEYEDGKRLYRIPKDGVLKTQFGTNFGIQHHQFFYVDSNGSRTKIQFVFDQNKDSLSKIEDKSKIYAFAERAPSGGSGFDSEIGNFKIPPTREFFIGNLLNIEKSYRERNKFSDDQLKFLRLGHY